MVFLFRSGFRRTCRSRKPALRPNDFRVNFFRGAELSLERRGRSARAERNQRLAQANSIARIASPAGMTQQHLTLFQATSSFPGEDTYGAGPMLFARKFSDQSAQLVARMDRQIGEQKLTHFLPA